MRHLSLFTGSGIGDLAAESAGIETVAQCENDPACLFALEKLWPGVKRFEDIRHVTVTTLRDYLPIDIISGGFPCQDLSTAGRGAGIEGSRSGLWREMFRVIRQVRPAWILVENVPAMRLRGIDRVLAPLARIGYACWPLVVGAWAVGAPHKRDRVWIVGRLADTRCKYLPRGRVPQDLACPQGEIEENGEQRQRLRDTVGDGCAVVADADQAGREEHPCLGGHDGTERAATIGSRWPSRPGEPQYDWEAPRLLEFPLGCLFDGFPERVQRRANKSALRILGNAWLFPLSRLVVQWIKAASAAGGKR